MIYYNHSENISRPANYLEPIRSTSDLDSSVNKLGVRQQSFVRSSTLAMSRKESTDYCNEFKNNTKMHNKINLLVHLANSLSRNTTASTAFPYNQISIVIPEYVFDWENILNESTGISYWKIRAKIQLSKIEIDTVLKLSPQEIAKSTYYYKKRLWLYHYNNYTLFDKTADNPLLIISRQNILEESFNQFMTTKELNLRCPIQIHFIDEVAHDAGGVHREWYCCLFREFFNEKNKLFILNQNDALFKGTFLIHPKTEGINMDLYNFFGKLLAKAIVDKTNITENLNKTIIKLIQKREITLDDMKYYDMDIYHALNSIKESTSNKDLEEFYFVWNTRDKNNDLIEVELIPNGRNIQLNVNNKDSFIKRAIEFITYEQYKEQIDKIVEGIRSLLSDDIINIFTSEEFDFLLNGQQTIDLEDWKANTIYRGKYIDGEKNKTIEMFWEVLSELEKNELFAFFQFCTGASRIPLDGFGALKGVNNKLQKFCIDEAKEKKGNGLRLIEAKTCFNRIYLPEYSSKEDMKKAISTIIGNDTSFFGLE